MTKHYKSERGPAFLEQYSASSVGGRLQLYEMQKRKIYNRIYMYSRLAWRRAPTRQNGIVTKWALGGKSVIRSTGAPLLSPLVGKYGMVLAGVSVLGRAGFPFVLLCGWSWVSRIPKISDTRVYKIPGLGNRPKHDRPGENPRDFGDSATNDSRISLYCHVANLWALGGPKLRGFRTVCGAECLAPRA